MNYKKIAKDIQCRFIKSRKSIESSNFNFDIENLEAWSYGWWRFSMKFGNFILFSDYSYSQSTSRHQSKAHKILCDLGYKNRIITLNNVSGISNPRNDIKKEIELININIKALKELINKKGTWKSTNKIRIKRIARMTKIQYELIQVLNEVGENYGRI